jgi:8-amino-7-oxononanoate synthase
MTFQERILAELADLKEKNRFRSLKEPLGIDFCSNDYLKLSSHPKLIQSLKEGIDLYGAGSTASRLIRGHRVVFEELESQFADYIKSEESLFVANGFLANIGLLGAITTTSSFVFCDRQNHASIMDGVRFGQFDVKYFKHNQIEHLEELLKNASPEKEKIVVTESLFSMDGDFCDLEKILDLKLKIPFTLILDEAHALGVYGKNGIGLSGESLYYSRIQEIDFRIFTAGKSMGLEGAFIACSRMNKEYLINKLRTFIFSTAPLPAIAHALKTSIELMKEMETERIHLREKSRIVLEQLKLLGYDTLNSTSHIIPVLFESDFAVMEASSFLQVKGFDVRGIRPPTVKVPRLRLSMNTSLTQKNLEDLLNHLKDIN